MGIIEKILSKSNSYNFYKSNFEKLKNNENSLKKEIKNNNSKQHDISLLRNELSDNEETIKKLQEKLEKYESNNS